MKRKFYCCSYQVTEDKNALRNISLSGQMGKGCMIGKDFKVHSENEDYILIDCTESDIEELSLGSIVTEICKY